MVRKVVTKSPVRMYPKIAGWRRKVANAPKPTAKANTKPRSKRIFGILPIRITQAKSVGHHSLDIN